MDESRALTLLKAAEVYLTKVRTSRHADAMCETVFYDEANCDGYCLLDDITAYLDEYRDNEVKQENLEPMEQAQVFIPIASMTPQQFDEVYRKVCRIVANTLASVVSTAPAIPAISADFKVKYAEFLVNQLNRPYCDNCRGNDDDADPDFCDDCHRKYMGWALSKVTAERLAEEAIKMLSAKEETEDGVGHANTGGVN